jgi:hypothetical protein
MTKARTLADNFAADINGITAGTGITGGGTSGTVTVTNSMATAIDAKGDLVVGTGADTFSRLAVASTAGYLLSVDSAEATGLKWAAPASGFTFAGCSVYRTADFTVSNNSLTAVAFTHEEYDTNGYHDNSVNNTRITIPSGKAGYYVIKSDGLFVNNANGYRELKIYKNGALTSNPTWYNGAHNGESRLVMVHTAYLAVGDYIETYVYQNSGGNLDYTYEINFQVAYIGA